MTKQLKLISLLLLVTSISFAQAASFSTTRVNIKNVINTEQAKAVGIANVGIVVKKNPGGGASRVGTTNDKGELELNITEKGDYTLTLSTSGSAVTTNNNIAARSQGGPVQGMKVALGKNPGGSATSFTITNDKGEAEFKNLEVGNYKIVVQQADRGSNLSTTQRF